MQLQEELLKKVKNRKNSVGKYYEINILMISRFLRAQK